VPDLDAVGGVAEGNDRLDRGGGGESRGFGGGAAAGAVLTGRDSGIEDLPAHAFPGRGSELTTEGIERHGGNQNPEIENSNAVEDAAIPQLSWEEKRERRIYRARTVTMLRRYMRYSIETGRLPSLLGRECFRTRVTSYTVVTFEDRVIFVHDMETCLNKLDEFSRQIIARHILQEHDQAATARLLGCAERTVRSYVPIALDVLTEILLDVGLLERIVPIGEESCQGGKRAKIS
jgi:sigma-70-like protein